MFVFDELLGSGLCVYVYLCKTRLGLTQKCHLAIVDADVQWLPLLWLTHWFNVME